MLHVSLTPQLDAGHLDFGRIKVFAIFSTHAIENQPIKPKIHWFSWLTQAKALLSTVEDIDERIQTLVAVTSRLDLIGNAHMETREPMCAFSKTKTQD